MQQNDDIGLMRPERGSEQSARGNAPGMWATHTNALKGQKHCHVVITLLPLQGVLPQYSVPGALPRANCSLPLRGDKRHEATPILARLSKIANHYIQWKSFDRS